MAPISRRNRSHERKEEAHEFTRGRNPTRDRETHFADLEFVRLPGHTPGMTGSVLHLETETLLFTGDQAALPENYEAGVPPGGDFIWGKTAWRASRHHLREIERQHDATVVFGHDRGGLAEARLP
jgi:glyoxylase-like metal-dependent hydrolase (beta-lactamase superfamily II)